APVTAAFSTADATALAGSDFTEQIDTVVSVPNGAATGTTTVIVADDTLLEGNETLTGTISNASHPAVTITDASATATILDNDAATASIAATNPTAAENPASSGQFTISL